MSQRKRYIPNHRLNPIVQAKRIDDLTVKIENHRRELEIVTQSYDLHMERLSNFAKHDMGNAIQSIYATLELSRSEFKESSLDAIKSAVDNLNETLSNFEQLVPYSKTGEFKLSKLISALEIMTRSSLKLGKIKGVFKYDRTGSLLINQPFQALLQLLHNLVLNSIKALKDVNKDKIIQVEATYDSENCYLYVKDTGCGILDKDIDKIFDYKFTTKEDGSGIGLYHAKYVCSNINGEISVERNVDDFATIFILKFPINGNKKNISN